MPNNGPHYEKGEYIANVIQQELGEASTGTPQFVLRFKILGKPDPMDPASYIETDQYDRSIYRAITDNTIEYFLEDLKVLGFTGMSYAQLQPSHPNHISFVGKQINVYCQHKANRDGKMQERWNLSRPRETVEIKPADSKKVRDLDSMFGKHLKGLPANKAAPRPVSVAATYNNPEITDDDIPF